MGGDGTPTREVMLEVVSSAQICWEKAHRTWWCAMESKPRRTPEFWGPSNRVLGGTISQRERKAVGGAGWVRSDVLP